MATSTPPAPGTPLTVLVHGNPETDAIWSLLVPALRRAGRDHVVCLSPPGFGASLPDGFPATAPAYVDWLVDELRSISRRGWTIDLVGHDWGAGHVFGVAAERPDLLRSWAADIAGLLDPTYRWHDAAAGWQTAEVGEAMIDAMVGLTLDEKRATLVGLGLTDDIATEIADALDADMGRAILSLYRSAPEPFLADLATRLAAAERRPALLIAATDDAYVAADLTPPVAERLGADVATLDGEGHWWMVSAPESAAAALIDFWARVDGPSSI